jgi:hypothetical protein
MVEKNVDATGSKQIEKTLFNVNVVKPSDFQDFIEAVKQVGIFWAVTNELPPEGVSSNEPKG